MSSERSSREWHPDMYSLGELSELSRCATPEFAPRVPPPPLPPASSIARKPKKLARRKRVTSPSLPPSPQKRKQDDSFAARSQCSSSSSSLRTPRSFQGASFVVGDRVFDMHIKKVGHCTYFYQDALERTKHWPHNTYHFWVEYDDGTRREHVPEADLLHVVDDAAAVWDRRFADSDEDSAGCDADAGRLDN